VPRHHLPATQLYLDYVVCLVTQPSHLTCCPAALALLCLRRASGRVVFIARLVVWSHCLYFFYIVHLVT
jgi:hypothetical protein